MSSIPPVEPSPPSGSEPQKNPDLQGLMGAQVRTTGDLKSAMISYLGEEDGVKMYNTFLQTIGMTMLTQVQHAADQAKKAAREMRKGGEQ